MSLKVFQPAAIAVAKTIILGCRSSITAARLASANVKFGMGNTLLELDGWSASAAVLLWNSSESSLLSEVTASVYSANGWYEAVKLTSSVPGTDFRINTLIDDETELLVDEAHTITTTGKAGSLTFTLSLGEITVLVDDIDLTLPVGNIQEAIEIAIYETVGIESGDVNVSVEETEDGYSITLTYAGQFSSQSITLPEIASSVLKPSTQATLVVTKAGSAGVNHEIELAFNVQPETETSSEEQQLTPSTSPAPSTGDFILMMPPMFMTQPIPYNATANDIATAINDAAGATLVACTGGPINSAPVRIAFTDTEDYPPFEVEDDGLRVAGTSPSAQVVEIVKGVVAGPGVNEVQSLSVVENTTGTLRLRSGSGSWSATISATANAATVETALEGILGSGNVSCTGGPLQTDAVDIEFIGSLAAADQPLLQIDLTALESDIGLVVEEEVEPAFSQQILARGLDFGVPITGLGGPKITLTAPAISRGSFRVRISNPFSSSTPTPYIYTERLDFPCSYYDIFTAIYTAVEEYRTLNPEFSDAPFAFAMPVGIYVASSAASLFTTSCVFEFHASIYRTGSSLPHVTLSFSDWQDSAGSPVTAPSDNIYGTGWPTTTSNHIYSVANPFIRITINGINTDIPISIDSTIDDIDALFAGEGLAISTLAVPFSDTWFLTPWIFKNEDTTPIEINILADVTRFVPGTGSSSYDYGWVQKTFEGNRITTVSYNAISTGPVLARTLLITATDTASSGNFIFSASAIGGSVTLPATDPNTLARNLAAYLLPKSRQYTTSTPETNLDARFLFSTLILDFLESQYYALGDITLAYVASDVLAEIEETEKGVLPGTNVYEQQRITFANTNGGTFTISDGTNTTADIAWNAVASQVLAACTAASLAISSVIGNLGGPYTLTFSTSGDKSLLTVDTALLTNYGSSQPTVTVTTIRDGGVVTTVGGLLGGTFDLRLERNSEVFMVLAIPYNVSNESLKSRIEAVIGITVTVSGGDLPGTPVSILFEDDVGSTPWVVTVVPHLDIDGEPSGTVTNLIAPSQNLPLNVWDLEIIPGTDTPGLKDISGAPDDWGYIVLQVETPEGTVSTDAEPATSLNEVAPDETPVLTRYPSLIKIKWIDLTAHALERTINEALGTDCCRVTQPIQSIQLEDFNIDVPVASGSGSISERVNCWYYRSVFRLSFFGRYADPDSLELAVQIPTYSDGIPISVKEFMTVTASSDPDGAGSLRNDVMGQDVLDAALEGVRIASAFYMAELGGEPLHSFRIVRSSSDGLLRWRFKLLNHYIIDTLDLDRPCYGIGRIRDCNVQFHWARVRYNEAAVAAISVYASTPMLPYDASAETFKAAIESIISGFFGSGNVRVLGKLYNSWEADSYDPSFIAADAPSNLGFNGLEVTLIGDLAYLPFDQYGLQLVMSIENRDTSNATPQRMFFYRADQTAITRQDMASMPMIHFESLADAPIPSTSQRTKIIFEGNGPFKVSIDGHEFTVGSTTTATAFQTAVNTYLGSLPAPTTALTTYAWDTNTSSWLASAGSIVKTWLPTSFQLPVRVFGSTPATGSFELLFRDYTAHTVSVGPSEYAEDPITITIIVQGAYGQSTEWVLTLPDDATAGSIQLDDQTYEWPIDLELVAAYISSEYGSHTATNLDLVTTFVFDGTDPYTFGSFTSSLLEPGSAVAAKSTVGGIDGSLLTYELVPGAGPLWFTSKANWHDAVLPNTYDEIFFDDAVGSVRYGIDLRGEFKVCGAGRYVFTDRAFRFRQGQAVFVVFGETSGQYWISNPSPDGTFSLDNEGSPLVLTGLGTGTVSLRASVEVAARYSGEFGLAQYRSTIPEYLPKYLAMDFSYLVLGSGGDGDGIDMGRFDTGTHAVTVTIHKSGDGDTYPAIQLLTDSNDTSIIATNASVGIGSHLGESSVFDSFTGNNTKLLIGRNVTYTSINNNDGETIIRKPTLELS